ncbi:DUF3768 domain-containing protein [Bradyrhizobium elkanii]|uniref:DUF3768 domain-containing protein n=1 Tax=Bradyrhizobium elkanii TaxID=29448 RepID=UPI003D1E852C
MDLVTAETVSRIRDLNDSFRRTFVGGSVLLTGRVAHLREEVRAEILNRVRTFERFTADNDPHGEHDFGKIQIGQSTFFFKIDYYDRAMENGSEDPADPTKTTRVLTVMFADEY